MKVPVRDRVTCTCTAPIGTSRERPRLRDLGGPHNVELLEGG